MLIEINADNPQQNKLEQVVEILRSGGVIIYPTDTVYAFGCDLFNRKAVERISRLKKLDAKKADFSIICYDLSHISNFTMPLNNSTFKLMKKALPGAYTFILNANNEVAKIFKSNKRTIGIRVPDHNIPRQLVKMLGNPIITTSVHDDDEIIEYTTDPELIHEKYEKNVDVVINGGYGNNEASTVFDCTGEHPEVVREGIGIIDGLV